MRTRKRYYRKYHYHGHHNRVYWGFKFFSIIFGGPGRRGR